MRSTLNMMVAGMILFLIVNFLALGYALKKSQQRSPEFAAAQSVGGGLPGAATAPPADPAKLKAAMTLGQTEYAKCAACHGADGTGVKVGPALMAPTLAGSEIALGEPDQAALVVLKGIRKENEKFTGIMAPLPLEDAQLAAVLTYVRNSFGNQAGLVTPEEAAAARTRFANVPAMVGRQELDGLLAANPKVAPGAGSAAGSATPAVTAPPASSVAATVPAKVEEPWVPIEGIRVVGGRVPSQRPEEAPPKPSLVSRDTQWFNQATHGLSQPHPSSFRFLEDQGEWFNPFTKPGMTGPYDIRNWHAR